MKRMISLFLTFLLLAAILSGCAGKPAAEQSSAAAPNNTELGQKTAEDLDKALDALATKGWPKDKLPQDLPEYTEGEIVNSGGDTETFYVKIDKTTEEALKSYLEKLKNSDWNVEEGSEPEAKKGVHSIRFSWQSSDHLQMALYTSEVGAWPKNQLPPDIIPPENCTFIGEIEITETEEDSMWYFNYECEGLDEAKAYAYMEMLVAKGWDGDTSMVTKDILWNGRNYSASIEIYEILDNSATFTCNYYIAN